MIAEELISTGERVDYTWDHRNRLTMVTFKNSGGTVIKTVEQHYDLFNRWIRSTLDSNGATAGGISERFFIYDGTQIVLEFDAAAATDVSHRYLWGPAVDQLLADEQVTSTGSAGSVVWPLGDHLGTLRDLATYNAGTDTTTVSNHRRYDSFGNLVSETNSAVDLLFGFTGRAYDEHSELQNNWNRWYKARIGQWTSEDPIGLGAGNPREFAQNQPQHFVNLELKPKRPPFDWDGNDGEWNWARFLGMAVRQQGWELDGPEYDMYKRGCIGLSLIRAGHLEVTWQWEIKGARFFLDEASARKYLESVNVDGKLNAIIQAVQVQTELRELTDAEKETSPDLIEGEFDVRRLVLGDDWNFLTLLNNLKWEWVNHGTGVDIELIKTCKIKHADKPPGGYKHTYYIVVPLGDNHFFPELEVK